MTCVQLSTHSTVGARADLLRKRPTRYFVISHINNEAADTNK